MPWYQSEALLPYNKYLKPGKDKAEHFRFPVSGINHPSTGLHAFEGTLAGGGIAVGDELMVAASLKRSRIKRIITPEGDAQTTSQSDSVSLVLTDEIGISAGDVLHRPGEPLERSDQFQAHLIWMHADPMLPERSYLLKIGAQTTTVQITELKYTININTNEHLPATKVRPKPPS